ncbi:MAG: hypothetical protein IKQ60_00140 [Candidatus Methanomethylophilaceae archaeon]|nr:hypothetical protein [Candidatus Methanomethylophilaceae archaeon]
MIAFDRKSLNTVYFTPFAVLTVRDGCSAFLSNSITGRSLEFRTRPGCMEKLADGYLEGKGFSAEDFKGMLDADRDAAERFVKILFRESMIE